MPYCLIGKLIVWGAGIALLGLLMYQLLMLYDRLSQRFRVRLLGTHKKFLIENIGIGACDIFDTALDRLGARRLNAWWGDMVLTVFGVTIFPIFILPAFLELGLRYVWYRWHKTAVPAALA